MDDKRMDRLTRRNTRGVIYIYKYDEPDILYTATPPRFTRKQDFTDRGLHDRFISFGNVAMALAAYEDTGLTPSEIARLTAENEALKAELNGNCWACAKAKPYPKSVTGTMMTCEHLSARNILATNASRDCPYWQWRGEKEKGNANATD